jgi:DNA-binding MarR family transcriptional regulator
MGHACKGTPCAKKCLELSAYAHIFLLVPLDREEQMPTLIDIQEVSGCSCLRARRAARHLTRLYDSVLEPVGITANQLGLLAKLLGASMRGQDSLSIGALADRVGMHPSTLNRDLKPLKFNGFVADGSDPDDRRVREVRITKKGQSKLRQAIPTWRRAQAQVQDVLGHEVMLSLNALLDLASAKLAR